MREQIWRAGCIIRSALLDDMSEAFEEDGTRRLFHALKFAGIMAENAEALQCMVGMEISARLNVPALHAAMSCFNASRNEQSTANMIQGLRDRFGAHTFERMDAPGEKVNGPCHD